MPALPSYLSINWMLNGQWGLINNIIWKCGREVDGPPWLDSHYFALGSVIYGHIWKWLPFWTLIFLAGRMAVSLELYEAAEVDGASRLQKFRYVTLPLMAGMYLVCTMLSTIWALGDFNAVRFISGGAPALSTHVLATLGIRNAFELGDPGLGMATVLTALPLLIPLVILADAATAQERGHDMTAHQRLDRAISSLGVWLLSAVLLVWTLLPIYNIVRVSMQTRRRCSAPPSPARPQPDAFGHVPRPLAARERSGTRWATASISACVAVALGHRLADQLRHQARRRIRSGWMLTNAALLTYVIPMSFLAIPFYGIMGKYGLTNNPIAVIAVEVTFATPYAIFIFQQYGASIPFELDEAARIDGASPRRSSSASICR